MTLEPLRTLVVDDEPPARRRLVRMLDEIGGCEVVASVGDGDTALEALSRLDIDLVLLDIGLPGLDGIRVAERAPRHPAVVFVTAHADFAVDAFETEAVDYLLKPVEPERLARAVDRARQRLGSGDLERVVRHLAARLERRTPRVSARLGDSLFYFDAADITCFGAEDKYTVFRHDGRRFLTDESLAMLEERLHGHGFLRVHRAALVRLDAVRAVTTKWQKTHVELIDGQTVPVSRRNLAALRQALDEKVL
ncbi:MAG: LytTR family DNA-binding domain-containing protein [Acidobacteriota bacterium]